jgi:putative nucleotidyltransferase with HDIG domain
MERIDKLEEKVRELYNQHVPGRADWADWLASNHVFVVADYASSLAKRFGANIEYSRAAALLHDIADAKIKRQSKEHEKMSLVIAREILQACGYKQDEIKLIVEDAIKYHSCYDGKIPNSLEGKVLASADSLAHLRTDFYEYASFALKSEKNNEQIKKWVLSKLDRDYNNKILFDEVKQEVEEDYRRIKAKFAH